MVLVSYYLPGFKAGGPIRAISNLVEFLSAEFDFKILTTDRDSGDERAYIDIVPGSWNEVGGAGVYYLSPQLRHPRAVVGLLRETPYDLLYVNSYFDPIFSIAPVIANRLGLLPKKPCVVAPRGEFADGALSIRRFKKSVFRRASLTLGLHRGVIWHASDKREAGDIVRRMRPPEERIHVAPDVTGAPPNDRQRPVGSGEVLRVCFVGRIAPVKNIDFSLRVLRYVRSPIVFHIYGPISDSAYWTACQSLFKMLPPHIEVLYQGVVPHNAVMDTLSAYDLLFAPSKGESFGHAIAEALAVGTPVLTSDQTPWTGITQTGAGWALSLLDVGGFVRSLEDYASLSASERAITRERASRFAAIHVAASTSVDANRRLLLSALGAIH